VNQGREEGKIEIQEEGRKKMERNERGELKE